MANLGCLANLAVMSDQNASAKFKHHPSNVIGRVAEPVKALTDHFDQLAGQFDLLSSTTDASQITATDLIAVSMAGSSVPAEATAWLLSDEGQWLTAEVLADIPDDATLQHCEPFSILRVADLFHLVRNSNSQLPARKRSRAMGQATATRLLAAKRPGLVPVDDQFVRSALGYRKDETWWLRWKNILDDETSDMLADIRSEAAQSAPQAAHLSDLRIFDILLRLKAA